MTNIIITNPSWAWAFIITGVFLFWVVSYFLKVKILRVLSGFTLIILAIKIVIEYTDYYMFAIIILLLGLFTFFTAVMSSK